MAELRHPWGQSHSQRLLQGGRSKIWGNPTGLWASWRLPWPSPWWRLYSRWVVAAFDKLPRHSLNMHQCEWLKSWRSTLSPVQVECLNRHDCMYHAEPRFLWPEHRSFSWSPPLTVSRGSRHLNLAPLSGGCWRRALVEHCYASSLAWSDPPRGAAALNLKN